MNKKENKNLPIVNNCKYKHFLWNFTYYVCVGGLSCFWSQSRPSSTTSRHTSIMTAYK